MTSNLLIKLKNLKENEIVIITDNVSKEEKDLLKGVLENENSKEVIEKILNSPITKVRSGSYLDIEIIESIKQSLDRLEKLEKEHNKLKERYKHRAETSNDLCKAVKQYEKAIEIMKDKNVHIKLFLKSKDANNYNEWISGLIYCDELTQKEYELIKEVIYEKNN